MALPHTEALVLNLRPTGFYYHMDFESLTHAEVGSVGIR